ncbi:MAG: LysR family transcriptional regulator [Rhodospirillales bacterium]|nr:LysR family transcriptional regulator [Rhodospirillales bacterium]
MKEKLNVDLRAVTLKQLRAFAAVLREGTNSGAAKTLNVTPPAITLQMQLLEDAAGVPIVERTSEGVRATDAGKEFLSAITRIEVILSECAEGLETLNGVNGGRVTVGIVSTAKYFAPRALAAYAKTHPNVDIRLQVGNRHETIEALRNYELDFAIMGRPPKDFAVDHATIGDHPHIIIGPPDHPLVERNNIPIAKLADETFLLREQGSGTRMLMENLFTESKVSPRIGMEMGSNETIKQAVMAGLGVALLSAHTVAPEIHENRLAPLHVKSLPIMRQWFVVKRAEKRLLPSASTLWDFLATSGEEFFPHP